MLSWRSEPTWRAWAQTSARCPQALAGASLMCRHCAHSRPAALPMCLSLQWQVGVLVGQFVNNRTLDDHSHADDNSSSLLHSQRLPLILPDHLPTQLQLCLILVIVSCHRSLSVVSLPQCSHKLQCRCCIAMHHLSQDLSSALACADNRAKGVGQRLLLRWVEQQWGSSQQALKDTRVHVRDLKSKAARDAVQQRDKRFLLEVDAVACRLLQVCCHSTTRFQRLLGLLCALLCSI